MESHELVKVGLECKICFTSDHRWVLKQCHPPGSVWGSARRVHWLDSGSWETSGQASSEPWSCVTGFYFCLYGFHTNFKMPTPRESDGAYESCKHVELCCADKKQQLSNSDDVTTQPFFLTASSTCKDMRIALLQSVHKSLYSIFYWHF